MGIERKAKQVLQKESERGGDKTKLELNLQMQMAANMMIKALKTGISDLGRTSLREDQFERKHFSSLLIYRCQPA